MVLVRHPSPGFAALALVESDSPDPQAPLVVESVGLENPPLTEDELGSWAKDLAGHSMGASSAPET